MKAFTLLLSLAATLCASAAGVILPLTYVDDGSFYPGTERAIEVYVPDAYDGTAEACLYVGLDGQMCGATRVMDSLTAAGKMPVTIAVFVQPGVIRDQAGTVVRYNRSNEFDATSDKFVRFLAEKLLPAVQGMTTPDGRPIRLSPRGEDHMIFGLSSGGIAAFVAAWHRPDVFGRVFSGVGTFVAMRGGNDLQAFVRKSEPRPLRIFLQDGSNDAWNPLFGSWYEGNRLLASALEFAGYDVAFDWDDSGHSMRRACQIYTRVMEWMWRDEPVCAGKTKNDLLTTLLTDDDMGWQPVSPTLTPTAKPKQAVYPDGCLMAAADTEDNVLRQYLLPDTTCGQVFYWLHSYDNCRLDIGGMAFDGRGNLWVVTNAGIQICDQNGRVRAILTLPPGVQASDVREIRINDGAVQLLTPQRTFERRLNTIAPHAGTRPESQGQG